MESSGDMPSSRAITRPARRASLAEKMDRTLFRSARARYMPAGEKNVAVGPVGGDGPFHAFAVKTGYDFNKVVERCERRSHDPGHKAMIDLDHGRAASSAAISGGPAASTTVGSPFPGKAHKFAKDAFRGPWRQRTSHDDHACPLEDPGVHLSEPLHGLGRYLRAMLRDACFHMTCLVNYVDVRPGFSRHVNEVCRYAEGAERVADIFAVEPREESHGGGGKSELREKCRYVDPFSPAVRLLLPARIQPPGRSSGTMYSSSTAGLSVTVRIIACPPRIQEDAPH